MLEILRYLATLLGLRKWFDLFAGPRRRKPIPPWVRRYLLMQAGYKCQRCGSTQNLQVDHVKPHSWGGSDNITNLQILCARCNRQKSNRHAGDYRWR